MDKANRKNYLRHQCSTKMFLLGMVSIEKYQMLLAVVEKFKLDIIDTLMIQ